jgi:hypothetical protein
VTTTLSASLDDGVDWLAQEASAMTQSIKAARAVCFSMDGPSRPRPDTVFIAIVSERAKRGVFAASARSFTTKTRFHTLVFD